MKAKTKNKKTNKAYRYFKRFIDLIISVIFLLVFWPLLLIIAICIKIDSNGPVIYKQKRNGLNGKVFTLYKFRSMVAENDVSDFSCEDKHTTMGKILRRLSFDELPQIFNILEGNMSFIGPRPWIEDYYNNFNDYQKRRCEVFPGITGLAQCSGRNNLTLKDRIDYDIKYVDNYSFCMDLKIFFKTIFAIFEGKGVSSSKMTIQEEIEWLKKENRKK